MPPARPLLTALAHRLGRRLAHRLFALFLLAAVLPLALSDWVSSTAVGEVARTLDARARTETTQRTSRQVFDRLLAGKTLLTAVPVTAVSPARTPDGLTWLPGLRRVFSRVTWLDARGVTQWSSDPDVDLGHAWQLAHAGPYNRPPIPEQRGDDRIEVRLRVAEAAGQTPRVLMAVSHSGILRWVAELDATHLWAPVIDAGEDSLWHVRDARGVLLARLGGSDALVQRGAERVRTQSRLYLGAEFGAGDWVFEQASPRPGVHWMGRPLGVWLALVAVATLIGIALLILWQLRHTLQPLAELTDGARRLAEGDTGARVAIDRADELGTLAQAFNHMAGRIEDREQQLVHRAVHDSLTGLANRDGLHDRLDGLLGAPGVAAKVGVLFLDLDHFKDVNDSRGHAVGDTVLRLVAQRLMATVPAGAFVARQGGDEFVIVLPEATEPTACAVAEAALAAVSQPCALPDGGEHLLGASVGVALSPQHGLTREELLRCADIALYAAKAAGRGRHQLFQRLLDVAARERVLLLAQLRQALARNEFLLHYQPRVHPVDGAIDSAEALIRWQHPEHGLLNPGAFIEVAEAGGLIDEIGQWVLDAACAQMAAWRRQGLVLGRVSVNVSPRQLVGGGLVTQVRDALVRHQLPPQTLELEVTESLLVGDARAACAQLGELRSWGVTVALDDFGTGYSSMATLRQLPIDVMKIDRAFVTDLAHDDSAMAVASAIVAMARALNLHLVAEGIETPAQAAILRDMGCDELQGFFYSRPLPPEAFHLLPRHLVPEATPSQWAGLPP